MARVHTSVKKKGRKKVSRPRSEPIARKRGASGRSARAHEGGRINQRRRTRAELLRAAARLLQERRGAGVPTIEEVAEEAMVSRATAYRYFPTIEALLLEAPLDGQTPDAAALFADDDGTDVVARVDRAESALHEMCYRNEAQLRTLLVNSLSRGRSGDADEPARQNRRTPLIESALAPARGQMDKATCGKLCAALALVFGTESMIVFRDVVPLEEDEAREVKRWAIRALVEAALKKDRE